MEQACFAAGPFRAAQTQFDAIAGVTKTTIGYSGGELENPSARDVAAHTTGHAEVVLIEFEVSEVTYRELCERFLELHDPTQLDHQGEAVGNEFRSAIFYVNEAQREVAEAVIAEAQHNYDAPIVTAIEPLGPFYQA